MQALRERATQRSQNLVTLGGVEGDDPDALVLGQLLEQTRHLVRHPPGFNLTPATGTEPVLQPFDLRYIDPGTHR